MHLNKKILLIISLAAAVLAVGVAALVVNHGKTVATDAKVSYFCFYTSGSSTYDFNSYKVLQDEETGEMMLLCELHYNESYSIPADEAFLSQIEALVAEHDLWTWNGFKKTNSLIQDGDSFSLYVTFADGNSIEASGNNSYPQGYGGVYEAIEELFCGYLSQNGLMTEGRPD